MNARSVLALVPLLALAFVAGCSSEAPSAQAQDTTAPTTTLDPPPGTFEEAVLVKLATAERSTISFTTDGSDPATSATATKGPAPQQALLKGGGKVTLRYFATDLAGNAEAPQSATYGLVAKLAPASLSGEVRVADGMRAGTVLVALYDADPTVTPAPQPVSYAQLAVGAGHAGWHFESLAAGSYWVAAAWWPGAVQGDPEAYVVAPNSPFSLDAADPAKARVDFIDLPIGLCGDDAHGIDGIVEVAPEFQDRRIAVVAMDAAPTGAGTAKPLAASLAVGTGASRPFALCRLPAKPAWIVIGAAPQGSSDWDTLWLDPASPKTFGALEHATYRLGTQDPTLGSIAGTVTLGAPAPGATLQVLLTSEEPSGTSPILQLVTLQNLGSAVAYPYTLHNVASGTYHVTAILKRAGQRDAYGTAPNQPVITLPNAPLANADLTVGFGRLHGDVAVHVAGAGQTVFVVGRRAGSTAVLSGTQVTLDAPDATGTRHAAYQLTGFPDGAFEVLAIYDANDDGQWQDDYAAGRYGTSPTATITNANDVAADVAIGP